MEMGVENGRLLAYLAAHGEVLSKHYHDSRVVIHCRIAQNHLGRIHEEATIVRPHEAGRGEGRGTRGEETSEEEFRSHPEVEPIGQSSSEHYRQRQAARAPERTEWPAERRPSKKYRLPP